MPWKPSDAEKHNKSANTDKKRRGWSEAANSAREKAIKDGKTEEEADAIGVRVGNAAIANMKEELQHGRLHEARTSQANPVEVVVTDDGETTILKNVLLCGNKSRNKADYTAAIKASSHLYEDAEVCIGHRYDGSNPKLDDRMGVIRNPHPEADGLHGDHVFPTKHRLAEDLVWHAKHAPKKLGYSPDHDCSWRYDSHGVKQVTSIDKVLSVDLVTRPATTGGLKEEELENMPIDQQGFAEHGLSAIDNYRSIILDSTATIAQKRTRLMEALDTFHGELLEGEIGDEMADSRPMRDMREMSGIAARHLDNAMWDHTKYPKPHDKIKRHTEVLKDHLKTLSGVKCNCSDCSGSKSTRTKEDFNNMEWKDITLDGLKANCPELVAKITGTDEHSRMTEEIATLKADKTALETRVATFESEANKRLHEEEIATELKAVKFPTNDAKIYSSRFKEQLFAAKDKTERAAIIRDRMELVSGRVTEAALPGPMEELRPENEDNRSAVTSSPSFKKLFPSRV